MHRIMQVHKQDRITGVKFFFKHFQFLFETYGEGEFFLSKDNIFEFHLRKKIFMDNQGYIIKQ